MNILEKNHDTRRAAGGDFHYAAGLLRMADLPQWKCIKQNLDPKIIAFANSPERCIVFNARYFTPHGGALSTRRLFITAAHEMSHAIMYGCKHGVVSGFRRTALSLGDIRPRAEYRDR